MQWLVRVIYGIILAFTTVGILAFIVQGFSRNTISFGTILLISLLWIIAVWFGYPTIREKKAYRGGVQHHAHSSLSS